MAAEVSDEEDENLLHIDDLQNLRVGNKVPVVTFTEVVNTICHLKTIVSLVNNIKIFYLYTDFYRFSEA
jgi:hypothetical protein